MGWKAVRSLATTALTLIWGAERIIGLAGVPDDLQTISRWLEMIPDWVGIAAATSAVIFTVQWLGPPVVAWAATLARTISTSSTIKVRYRSVADGDVWSEMILPSTPGLLHRVPLKDDGHVSLIEVPDRWELHFVDMPAAKHFWTTEVEEGVRRYECRYIPKGDGYEEARFTVEPSSQE